MANTNVSFLTSKTGWSSSLNKALADAIFSRSKITAKQSEIEADVKTIMDVVNQVNACDFDTRRLGNERLEDVVLPTWATDFVMPSKMTLTANQWATDLLVRPELQADFVYDETAVRNAAHRLAKTQKLEPNFVSATVMRGSTMVSLMRRSKLRAVLSRTVKRCSFLFRSIQSWMNSLVIGAMLMLMLFWLSGSL